MGIWKPSQVMKDEQKKYLKKIEGVAVKMIKLGYEEQLNVKEFVDAFNLAKSRLELAFTNQKIDELIPDRGKIEKVKFN